jgi:hypothetical protein
MFRPWQAQESRPTLHVDTLDRSLQQNISIDNQGAGQTWRSGGREVRTRGGAEEERCGQEWRGGALSHGHCERSRRLLQAAAASCPPLKTVRPRRRRPCGQRKLVHLAPTGRLAVEAAAGCLEVD